MQVKIIKRGEYTPTFIYESKRGYTGELRIVQTMFKVVEVVQRMEGLTFIVDSSLE